MFSVRMPVNSGLLVTFWWQSKVIHDFYLHEAVRGLSAPNSSVVPGSTVLKIYLFTFLLKVA